MSQPYPDPVAQPRPKRGLSTGWTIALIAAALLILSLAGVALVVGAGALFVLTAEEVPVVAADRAAILTADDFAESWSHEVDPAAERLEKVRYVDGTRGLEYTYDDGTLYVYASIDVEKSASDARATYAGMVAANGLGLAAADGFERRDDLFQWGDASRFYRCVEEERTSGYVYAGREGAHVLYAAWSGLVFADDASEVAEFLTPVLERMARHAP